MSQADLYRYGITAVIVVAVMALRFRNVGKMRRLRLETLWIVPAIYVALTAATFAALPPPPEIWPFIAIAAAAGAAVGWQRGKMMHIEVEAETHTLNQRTSPTALLFIVVILIARQGAGALARQGALHINVATLTDLLMAFALGMFAATRIEMYLRAKRLLAAARAA